MKSIIDKFEFISFKDNFIELNFSTAKNGLDFNMNTQNGLKNLENIKKWFDLNAVGYLRQTHSDEVVFYDSIVKDGDALITDKPNIAIGVFTADCVPVLIYDKKNKIIAAVHSGWKGTLMQIVSKTILTMRDTYKISLDDIIVYIGPHNRSCCYEFGKEALKQFYEADIYKELNIYINGKLDLNKCIRSQLINIGLNENNIQDVKICTSCDDEYELFSYRKQKENCGRMFSFIFIRK
ncbi:peptidoglycan editing factor PgeF [Clostridium akagii]|uniref:peptidoglycan editing factor PgeF n=1 Tax=Clostridium akagii TaxID=91623 RepID=UPI000479A5C1|nr:peptidoglycan editing factor PgeF [Clostridium akagii]